MLLQDLIKKNDHIKQGLPKEVLLMVEVLEKIQYKDGWQIVWDWTPSRIENDRRFETFEIEIIFLDANRKAIPAHHFSLADRNRPYTSKAIQYPLYPVFLVSNGRMYIKDLNDFLYLVYSFIEGIERGEAQKSFLFEGKPLNDL
jgi:hypothetical protein